MRSKLVSDFAPQHAFSSERVLKEPLKLRNLNNVAYTMSGLNYLVRDPIQQCCGL